MTIHTRLTPSNQAQGHVHKQVQIQRLAYAALISHTLAPANATTERAALDLLIDLIDAGLARMIPVNDGRAPKTAMVMAEVSGLIDGRIDDWSPMNALRLLADWRNQALKTTGWKFPQ